MVKDIDETHPVEGVVGERDLESVEFIDWDLRVGAHKHIDAPDLGIPSLLQAASIDLPIAAANVEH